VCKNNAETDQETSIVQGIRRYYDAVGSTLGDTFLDTDVDGVTVMGRLELALQWLVEERMDSRTSLIWGGTTLDWGDVQPERDAYDCRLLGNRSHLAIDIYDNAMFTTAIEDFLYLCDKSSSDQPCGNVIVQYWGAVLNRTKASIRHHLWDAEASKWIPHLYFAEGRGPTGGYLPGSPFPDDFDEMALNYHGGTSQAALAGLMTTAELSAAVGTMEGDVLKAGGKMTVGLTIYPPYPDFKNTTRWGNVTVGTMDEWTYQNGGDWAWFGGRTVQALVRAGLLSAARRILLPMANRVVQHGGFYEWWGKDGSPQGSDKFHGAAGVLGQAIVELLAAEDSKLK